MLVKIKCTVVTAEYGTLSEGTLLRTSEAFAKHLVEDASAAEYVVNTDTPAEVVEKKRVKNAKE